MSDVGVSWLSTNRNAADVVVDDWRGKWGVEQDFWGKTKSPANDINDLVNKMFQIVTCREGSAEGDEFS